MKNNNGKKIDPSWRKETLKQSLNKVLNNKTMTNSRELVNLLAADLNISVLDCAAALLELQNFNPHIELVPERGKVKNHNAVSELKMVPYRLEVGHKHQVSIEELKNTLVEEAGVEKKLIGRVDIHHVYTLIRLPSGMPADIFNHLKSVQINQQALCIKRLGKNNRKSRLQKKSQRSRQRILRQDNKNTGNDVDAAAALQDRGQNNR